ncbi:hypothetical protein ASPWEDRAFT_677621 [Aspergillus wentii DTO 134E9]|uniref:Uncharacterized protein n=1 Tax=Aspergillus wentii DTO 134E9 TaxID=1073089 RepID=A0A1L9R7Z7_ASPWE|nr:uncharacterized protein ASPWEDRAFT_677621 [Aspergillus wentii DTO 134E9]OJJ31050.1 hypothetical protein ASPWEDRAFT_677621 [Aspergillus wentii DTO 134E9]
MICQCHVLLGMTRHGLVLIPSDDGGWRRLDNFASLVEVICASPQLELLLRFIFRSFLFCAFFFFFSFVFFFSFSPPLKSVSCPQPFSFFYSAHFPSPRNPAIHFLLV